jgi:hypothetical protein
MNADQDDQPKSAAIRDLLLSFIALCFHRRVDQSRNVRASFAGHVPALQASCVPIAQPCAPACRRYNPE